MLWIFCAVWVESVSCIEPTGRKTRARPSRGTRQQRSTTIQVRQREEKEEMIMETVEGKKSDGV